VWSSRSVSGAGGVYTDLCDLLLLLWARHKFLKRKTGNPVGAQ